MSLKVWAPGDVLRTDDLNRNFAIVGPVSFTATSLGMRFDGVTDDTAAWVAALALIAATPGGGIIVMPPGRSMISTALHITLPFGAGLVLDGAGDTVTDLCFTTETDGLSILLTGHVQGDLTNTGGATLRNFGITRGTPTAWAQTGLRVEGPRMDQSHVVIENLGIRGINTQSCWLVGIEAKNLIGMTIRGFRYFAYGAPTSAPTVGIAIHGDGLPAPNGAPHTYAIDAHLDDMVMTGGDRGVVINGWVQGVYISNSSIGANNIAVDMGNGTFGAVGGEPELLSIEGGTLNSQERCIRTTGGGLHKIHGVLMQAGNQLGNDTQWTGVELRGANYVTLVGNTFQGLVELTGANNAIHCPNGASMVTITGNLVDLMNDAAIVMTGAPDDFTAIAIDGNVFRNVGRSFGGALPRQVMVNGGGRYLSIGSNYLNGARVFGLDYITDDAGNLVQTPGSRTSLGTGDAPLGGAAFRDNVTVGGSVTTLNLDITGIIKFVGYTVANLPLQDARPGWIAFATNGCKPSEGAGAGTGVPVFWDGTAWFSVMGGVVRA